MRSQKGVEVHIWGQARKQSGMKGPVWNVDKGTVKGMMVYGYGVLLPDGVWFDTTRWTLFLKTDAPLATGDKFIIDGNDYYGDGDLNSWKVFNRNGLHHFEVALKAVP